jgi:hypothetical protein
MKLLKPDSNLRKIEFAKLEAATKTLHYVLIPGEIKKNYCKIMTNIRLATGNNAFILAYAKERIMLYGNNRVERQYKHSIRPERQPIKENEATALLQDLINQKYLKYIRTQNRDKLHPNLPEEGVKYYAFEKFKVIECQQSKYFQSKQRKTIERIETRGALNEKRCRALRQIYAQFEDKSAFTYEMVKNIPKFYKKMADDKKEEMSIKTREFYFQAARHAESINVDFLDTWNSLIRNNFIVPYKIRAKDGLIKTVPGAYKVNMNYVKRCLSKINL